MMFKDRIVKKCPLCTGSLAFDRLVYTAPPSCEVSFQGLEGQKYHRSYHVCQTCGHFISSLEVDTHEMYAGEYVASNYGDVAGLHQTFLRIRSLPPERSDNVGRVARVVAFSKHFFCVDTITGKTLLDVGAGLGVFPYAMKEQGFVCTALDPDPLAVEHMKSVGIAAVRGVFENAGELGEFDIITLNKVIEHVNDPVAMLSCCHRYLQPRGMVYVEVPDGENAVSAEGQDREEFTIDHIHVFSRASFELVCERAGFTVITMERLCEPSSKFTLRAFLSKGVA